jgi:hypothetical protein
VTGPYISYWSRASCTLQDVMRCNDNNAYGSDGASCPRSWVTRLGVWINLECPLNNLGSTDFAVVIYISLSDFSLGGQKIPWHSSRGSLNT